MLGKIHKEVADTRLEMRERFEQVQERLNKMEEKLETTSQNAKKASRSTQMLYEDLLRTRVDREELRERIAELEQQRPEAA